MKKFTTILATLLLVPGFGLQARAQGVFDMGSLTNTLSMGAVTQSEKKRGLKHHRPSASKGAVSRPVSLATARKLMTFSPSVAQRQKHLNQFLLQLRKADPTSAKEVQSIFKSTDVFRNADVWMNRYGLKRNNLADSIAVYLSSAWLVSRGSDGDPTKAQIIGVRDQMARAFVGTSKFRSVSNATKQELADSMILHSSLLSIYVISAKKRPALMPKVKSAAVNSALTNFGLNLNAMKLTNRGLQM